MKLLALMLAMLLALPALAEGFTGVWQDPDYGRAVLTILPDGDEYAIELDWSSAYDTRGEWRMTGRRSGDALVYENGTMAEVNYGENGEAVSEKIQWNDAKGSLTLTGSDTLAWQDSREERAADFSFRRQNVYAPTAAELVSGYLDVVARQEAGSAGYSLKLAKAACSILRFALEGQLWNADADEMEANLITAWEALGEDRQARFTENYPEIAALADDVFAAWDDARYAFEDAGVGDEMSALLENRALRPSWQTLAEATEALRK